jgi:O-methyltransferase
MELRSRYLELLKRSVRHANYGLTDLGTYPPRNPVERTIARIAARRSIVPLKVAPNADEIREEGRDWPLFAQSMVGRRRLDNLQFCVEQVIGDGVPGDLIEVGAWRGGSAILMRAVLAAHDIRDRTVWVADSFEGLPPPDPSRYPADGGARWHGFEALAVSLDEVKENFRRYDLLDDQVRFLKGWFRDTLPTLSGHRWAVVRLDGDMYESTMDGLVNLYPGLSVGGYLIVDDYSISSCREAVQDFRRRHDVAEELVSIDWSGVYWRRER